MAPITHGLDRVVHEMAVHLKAVFKCSLSLKCGGIQFKWVECNSTQTFIEMYFTSVSQKDIP